MSSREYSQQSFDEACSEALSSLQENLDFGLWMVTKADGEDWIILKSLDRGYGVEDGDVFRWCDSFCHQMVGGKGPNFAPDSRRVPAYAQANIAKLIPIQAYMGFPLRKPSGELIGTLCAINPTQVPSEWSKYETYAKSMAAKIEEAFNREVAATEARQQNGAGTDLDQENIQVLLSSAWDSLLLEQEVLARESGENLSVLMVQICVGWWRGCGVAETLLRVVGRSNHLSYLGNGQFAALLLECNAPKLDAYVDAARSCLANLGVDYSLGYSVRNNARGVQFSFDQARAKLHDIDPLRQAA